MASFFYQLRKQLFKLYPSLFETEDENGVDSSKILDKELERDMENTFEKRFGWYVVLNRVAKNDIGRHTQIFEKKIMEVLNQLLYMVEYDKEQIRLQKKQTSRL